MSIKSQFDEIKSLLDQVHNLIDSGSQSDVTKASSILKSILPLYKTITTNPDSKVPENYELLKDIKIRLTDETNRVISIRGESKKTVDNTQKPIEIVKPPPLQGYLKKLGEKGLVKSFKKRWFLQKDTKLYYYEKENDTNSFGFINLPDMLSVKTIDGGFELATPGRVYTFQVFKSSDLSYWIDGLSEYKKYYVSLQNSIKNQSSRSSTTMMSSSLNRNIESSTTSTNSDHEGSPQHGSYKDYRRAMTMDGNSNGGNMLSKSYHPSIESNQTINVGNNSSGNANGGTTMSSSYSSVDDSLKKREEELRRKFLEEQQQKQRELDQQQQSQREKEEELNRQQQQELILQQQQKDKEEEDERLRKQHQQQQEELETRQREKEEQEEMERKRLQKLKQQQEEEDERNRLRKQQQEEEQERIQKQKQLEEEENKKKANELKELEEREKSIRLQQELNERLASQSSINNTSTVESIEEPIMVVGGSEPQSPVLLGNQQHQTDNNNSNTSNNSNSNTIQLDGSTTPTANSSRQSLSMSRDQNMIAMNNELTRKLIEDEIRKKMLEQQDQLLDIERQRRDVLEREVKKLKETIEEMKASQNLVNNVKFELQLRDGEIDRLKKEVVILEASVVSLEKEKKELSKPIESFPKEYHWSQEISSRDKKCLQLQSRINELDENLKIKENAVSVIKRENEILREETEKKDRYISDLIEKNKSLNQQQPKNNSNQSGNSEIVKLKESLFAHQTQNSFLSAEIKRLETENQLKLEIKNDQIKDLQQTLTENMNHFEKLRDNLLGHSMKEYCVKLENENLSLKKEYFLALAVSIKLHRSLAGEMSNIDTVSLWEEAVKLNVQSSDWVNWITNKFNTKR